MKSVVYLLCILVLISCSTAEKQAETEFGWRKIAQFEYQYLEGETLSSFILPLPKTPLYALQAGFKYRIQLSPAGKVTCAPGLNGKIFNQVSSNNKDYIEPIFPHFQSEIECFIDKKSSLQTINLTLESSAELTSTHFYQLYAQHFSYDDGRTKNEKVRDFIAQLDDVHFGELIYYLSLPIKTLELDSKNPRKGIQPNEGKTGDYYLYLHPNPHVTKQPIVEVGNRSKSLIPSNPLVLCQDKNKNTFNFPEHISLFHKNFSGLFQCRLNSKGFKQQFNLRYTLINHTDLKNIIESQHKNFDQKINERLNQSEIDIKNNFTLIFEERLSKNKARNSLLASLNDVFDQDQTTFIEKIGFEVDFVPVKRKIITSNDSELKSSFVIVPWLVQQDYVSSTFVPLKGDSILLYLGDFQHSNSETSIYKWNFLKMSQFLKEFYARQKFELSDLAKYQVSQPAENFKQEVNLRLMNGGKCYQKTRDNKAQLNLYYGTYSLFDVKEDEARAWPKATSRFFTTKKANSTNNQEVSIDTNLLEPKFCVQTLVEQLTE